MLADSDFSEDDSVDEVKLGVLSSAFIFCSGVVFEWADMRKFVFFDVRRESFSLLSAGGTWNTTRNSRFDPVRRLDARQIWQIRKLF